MQNGRSKLNCSCTLLGPTDGRREESWLFGSMAQQKEVLRKTSAVETIKEQERRSYLE